VINYATTVIIAPIWR